MTRLTGFVGLIIASPEDGLFTLWNALNYPSGALYHFHQENGIKSILNILLILSKSSPERR